MSLVAWSNCVHGHTKEPVWVQPQEHLVAGDTSKHYGCPGLWKSRGRCNRPDATETESACHTQI